MRQDDLEILELDRLIENHKLKAEGNKLLAEASKLEREAFWYPFAVHSAVLGAFCGTINLPMK